MANGLLCTRMQSPHVVWRKVLEAPRGETRPTRKRRVHLGLIGEIEVRVLARRGIGGIVPFVAEVMLKVVTMG